MSNQTSLAAASIAPDQKRRRNLILLAIACLLAALGYGLYWFFFARFNIDTDNAYVQGNVV